MKFFYRQHDHLKLYHDRQRLCSVELQPSPKSCSSTEMSWRAAIKRFEALVRLSRRSLCWRERYDLAEQIQYRTASNFSAFPSVSVSLALSSFSMSDSLTRASPQKSEFVQSWCKAFFRNFSSGTPLMSSEVELKSLEVDSNLHSELPRVILWRIDARSRRFMAALFDFESLQVVPRPSPHVASVASSPLIFHWRRFLFSF